MTHPQVALGKIATLIRGITYKPSDVCEANTQSAVACMRTKNVQENLDESDIAWIPASIIRNSSKYLNPGDILVSSANSWNLVGKGCWVPELKYPASAGGFISILRGNQDIVDLRYLYHWFVSPQTQAKLRSYSNKTTNISNLDHSRTLATEIPLPPLEEQRRIAAILDKADLLASLQARASVISKEWVSSVYSESFVDSQSYIEISIEEALESQMLLLHKDGNHGGSYPRAEDFGDEGVPFISAKSIDDSGTILDSLVARLSEEKAQSLQIGWLEPGDVLLAHNASVGKTALYEGQYQRALIGTSLTAFRPNLNHLNSHYLLHYLSSPSFQSSLAADMSQTTRNQVPITAQRRLALRIPPLSKQEEFAARVMSADRFSEKRRQSFRCVDALRKSLFGALLST
jgi:type I restriction enzyme S subunit